MSGIAINEKVLQMFLPKLIVDHFDLVRAETKLDSLHFYYVEKKIIPSEYVGMKLHSKGYYNESKVEDFPIRGKSVFLYIKRRKWEEIASGKIIKRDWNLVAKGTRMTSEFATFLKELYL